MCRPIALPSFTTPEFQGFCTMLDPKWALRFHDTLPLGAWAHGLKIAIFVGLDKLDDMIKDIWRHEDDAPQTRILTIRTLLNSLRARLGDCTGSCARDFEMRVWNANPDWKEGGRCGIDVREFLSVRLVARCHTPPLCAPDMSFHALHAATRIMTTTTAYSMTTKRTSNLSICAG